MLEMYVDSREVKGDRRIMLEMYVDSKYHEVEPKFVVLKSNGGVPLCHVRLE